MTDLRITKSLATSSVTTGTGTANTIVKYTAASVLGNSSITDNGTTVSLGGKFNVTEATGLPVLSNNIALVGQGFVLIVAAPAGLTAQTAAVTNHINFTPAAAVGAFRINWAIDTTTSTTNNFTVVVTYKNATGTARTQNSGGFDKNGTGLVAGAITNVIGAGAYYGSMNLDIDNSGTAITLSTAGTFTTVTYNLRAWLEQVS